MGTRVGTSTVIEVAGEQVGLVVPHARGVQFFAADRTAGKLEGQIFPNVAAATRAATALLDGRSRPESPARPASDRRTGGPGTRGPATGGPAKGEPVTGDDHVF